MKEEWEREGEGKGESKRGRRDERVKGRRCDR